VRRRRDERCGEVPEGEKFTETRGSAEIGYETA
jgi:hypothetical protein